MLSAIRFGDRVKYGHRVVANCPAGNSTSKRRERACHRFQRFHKNNVSISRFLHYAFYFLISYLLCGAARILYMHSRMPAGAVPGWQAHPNVNRLRLRAAPLSTDMQRAQPQTSRAAGAAELIEKVQCVTTPNAYTRSKGSFCSASDASASHSTSLFSLFLLLFWSAAYNRKTCLTFLIARRVLIFSKA